MPVAILHPCQSQSCIKERGRVGGNTLDFVAAMERCSVRDAAIKLQTWFLVPAAGNELVAKDKTPIKEPHVALVAANGPEPELVSNKVRERGRANATSRSPSNFGSAQESDNLPEKAGFLE
jgi:hypothetical protein